MGCAFNPFCRFALLIKREVKMAGYWPRSFFAFFMDRDEGASYIHVIKISTYCYRNTTSSL